MPACSATGSKNGSSSGTASITQVRLASAFDIAPANVADRDALIALDPRAATEPLRLAQIDAALAAGDAFIARARNAEPVGFAITGPRFFGHPFLSLLVVGEGWRLRGAGKALLAHVEAACGGDRLFTSTNRSNLAMRALLSARGFAESGLVENLDPGDPELIYVKFL